MTVRHHLIGGVTSLAVLGIGLSVAIAAPASAAPSVPSWSDVQAAKASTAATQVKVNELMSTLTSLQDQSDAATVTEQEAAQAYSLAASKQEAAQADADDLTAQSKRARVKADASAGRVAALVVELSRAGGGDFTSSMLVNGKDAKDLLYQVGTMSHLSERSATILARAQEDQRTVDALQAQARTATTALAKATKATQSALDDANQVSASLQTRLATQQDQQNTLISQLAYLKNTTAATEAAYLQDQQAKAAEAKLAASVATTPTPSKSTGGATGSTGGGTTSKSGGASNGGGTGGGSSAHTGGGSSSGGATGGGSSSGGSSGGGSTAGGSTSGGSSGGGSSSVSRAAGAIAYARAQLGKAYVLGGAGPNTWDCSGLVMMAYSSQGIATGGHNVVWQYNHFASIGRLVPLSQRQPGDILFYSSNGTASGGYHDSIYTGGGRMVEAANSRVGVVERAVWGTSQLLPYVARPSGSL